jgi:geranylgeranyl diphosphate synthase type I
VSVVAQYKSQVDEELGRFFTGRELGKDGIELRVISALKEFTMRGGKRVRPLFMILGYWLNSDIDERIIRASISLELMQSYLLIHDDIIDQSPTRRGGPSFHKMWNYEERMNEGISIVAADLADAYSHEILLSNDFPPENLNRAMMAMSETVEMTGIGQLMDITMPLKDKVTLGEVTKVHVMKTAHYTVNGPMKMGAYLSGYPNVGLIDHYGIPLGIAFQIQDDILGMYGDEKTLGKPVTSDFEEGKMTHLILNAFDLASENDIKFIKKFLGKPGISQSDFEEVRNIIKSSGALAKTKELALSYYNKAISSIPELTDDSMKVKELEEMAKRMVDRIN